MPAPPEPRWWRRRRDLALHAAREAKGRAAVALVHLDGAQRSAASHLDFIAGVDGGATAQRLRREWAPVSAEADAAIAAYLESAGRWDVTADLELEDAAAAAAAFAHHEAAMSQALARIEQWSHRSTEDFVQVTRTLEQLTAQRARAEQALADAHARLQAAEAGGWRAWRGRELLEQGLDRFRVVERGPAAHGMPEVMAACEQVAQLAAEAGVELDGLPELRDRVRHRTLSLQTRLSALEWRAQQGSDDVLRTLRREYVLSCSVDLDDSAQQTGAALERVRAAMARAAAAAAPDVQRWHVALDHLEQAREALDQAQQHVDEPRERLALLREVSADPRRSAAAARFAVRDARQLLMAGSYEDRQARALDALAARLDRADELLDRPHPDWLEYAHTLDAIIDGARGLVVDVRASRAR